MTTAAAVGVHFSQLKQHVFEYDSHQKTAGNIVAGGLLIFLFSNPVEATKHTWGYRSAQLSHCDNVSRRYCEDWWQLSQFPHDTGYLAIQYLQLLRQHHVPALFRSRPYKHCLQAQGELEVQ